MWKKISLILFIIFYGFAGINHFLNPETYEQLIPNWLGDSAIINLVAGVVEIAVAILAIFKPTRKWAGYLTIAMLLAFIISHVYYIQLGHCAGDLCLDPWIGWIRLVVIHPLLIYWAYRISNY
ncbi:Uncharacterized membrane protein [Nonlabens sp. Hel1_33_55]|uniref:DoxX family protein n=1 Tax=Nonlabens sp. Hel1_33_55 TaxID=1336802 RepID=UPI000875CE59|nr:MauE/DoxX family redox-associated membrane protein [Nonlabens sp. Hel1_33_55]SCY06348.1 Uncharacterized membrane protein [Nonlabens sp. Hel1_33_55]